MLARGRVSRAERSRRHAAALSRVAGLTLAIALAASAAGCASSEPSFPVTDPRELLSKALDRTIALQRVHLDVQLAESGGLTGGPDSATLQADLDVANGELSLAAKSSEAAAAPVGLVIADGRVFTSNGGAWDVTDLPNAVAGSPLAMLPAREQLAGVLRAIGADERVSTELRDPVECSVGRCYSLVVNVPMPVLWDHLGPIVRPAVGFPDALPADVPPVDLLLYVDPATFDPVFLELVFAPSGGRVRLLVKATGHDRPMEIKPPQ